MSTHDAVARGLARTFHELTRAAARPRRSTLTYESPDCSQSAPFSLLRADCASGETALIYGAASGNDHMDRTLSTTSRLACVASFV